MVNEIGDSDFNEAVIREKGAVLLLVYATWCGDCRRILPVFSNCADLPEYKEVTFRQMDVDKNPQTKKNLDVQRYPTLFLFQAGKKISENVAELSADGQKVLIQSMLKEMISQEI